MCGRVVITHRPVDFITQLNSFDTFSIITINLNEAIRNIEENFEPRYNIAPSSQLYAIYQADGEYQIDSFRWGLIPTWAKDESMANKCFNARSETIAEKPTFRNAYKKSRCIVPIDGYFEWKTGADKKKQPFFIRNETAPLYLAGLCEPSTRSLTIVTCEAEAKLRDIHNRRPIALSPDEIQTWLDPKSTQVELLMAIKSSEIDKVKTDMVSTKVNSVANDGPELLELIAS